MFAARPVLEAVAEENWEEEEKGEGCGWKGVDGGSDAGLLSLFEVSFGGRER